MNNFLRDKRIIAVILIMIFPLVCGGYYGKTQEAFMIKKKLTRIQWEQDIDYFQRVILENNGCKFKDNNTNSIIKNNRISKDEFCKRVSELKKEISNLTDLQIQYKLEEITASLGDAHTSVWPTSESIYPFRFEWFDNDLRVVSANSKYEYLLGTRLVKINNISVNKVLKSVDKIISHENINWLRELEKYFITQPDALRYFNVTSEDNAKFTFISDDGKYIDANINSVIGKKVKWVRLIDKLSAKPVSEQVDKSAPYSKYYWYKYIPKNKVLYFRCNTCMDKKFLIANKEYDDYRKYPVFDEFSDGIIKMINENDVDKFVIDMRGNPGGYGDFVNTFIQKLKIIDKINNKVKIFVLINKGTFSAGVISSYKFKSVLSAILVGEPTGGNVNFYAGARSVMLPNSKMNLQCSNTSFYLDDKYKDALLPDIYVNQSFKDYKNGIDDAYEAILKYKR